VPQPSFQEVEQLSCPQCQATNQQGSASCDHCSAALTGPSASQFPRTPAEQFLPDRRVGQYVPGSDIRSRQFRPDWRRLTREEQAAGGATLVVLVSLFLPWFGLDDPGTSTSVSGTGAHGYLVIVALLAVLTAGYLLQRSGREQFPLGLPVAHETVLMAGAGLQFAGVAIGFADVPAAGLRWKFGAFLALIAAAAALGAALVPVLRSRQAHQP
jgi:hypothetical protein